MMDEPAINCARLLSSTAPLSAARKVFCQPRNLETGAGLSTHSTGGQTNTNYDK